METPTRSQMMYWLKSPKIASREPTPLVADMVVDSRIGAPSRVSGWPLPRFVQKDEPPAVSSCRNALMIATFATQEHFGALRNRGGRAPWVAYTSPIAITSVVAVVITVVAAETTPCVFGGVPFPVANWDSSSLSLASASRPGSCWPKSVSSKTSYDPKMYASAFCGVMTMFATVGVASANTDASPIICAVTPAELTPFHVLLVVVTTREIRRHGLALDEFVRMIVGSSTNGSRYPPLARVRDSAARCASPCGSARYARNASWYSSDPVIRTCRAMLLLT